MKTINWLAKQYATIGGLGFIIYPGLFGAVTGTVLAYLLWGWPWYTRLPLIILLAILAVPAATRAERMIGRKDPRPIIIDEVVGVLIATLPVSFDPWMLFVALFWFLFFDWLKPWPAYRFEYLPGGWGILLDDVTAGVYALILTLIVAWF
ncbi:MAG: phosphatidylglycerophosphatase A [Candidatus Liptonbacteria bacterium]|nr:phosphatidylglycerophosphatase A [Candidatus Liptonbacteria bacterium]